MTHDFLVIGGGIVGLATARALQQRWPGRSLLLLEKEPGLARHQTGRNSGVIHAGVYYPPGSLKARLCKAGAAATEEFCARHGIAFERCGKLLVATRPEELPRMAALRERCGVNGIEVVALDAGQLREREPKVQGLGALFVPATGMVRYAEVCEALANELRAAGGELRFGEAVHSVRESGNGVFVGTGAGAHEARVLVACAGIMADRVAQRAGLEVDFRMVPFRGEYYRLAARHDHIVQHHVYPIPDPALPFLGVHLTRMIDGHVTVGPNAVLGLAREGYARGAVSARDLAGMAGFAGFWRMARRHLRPAATEQLDSWSRRRYLALCQRYAPSLQLEDLEPHPTGIRAQAVMNDGSFMHDFLFREGRRSVHVCNAPSPAATSALPIGAMVAERVAALGVVAA
jgi:(S)-2-hydroxyglutarate dehydrogenase